LFFDFYPWFEHDVSFRTSITYSQKIEKFLPGNNIDLAYPFIKSYSLRGFIRQDFLIRFISKKVQEFFYLTDRTFVNVNVWNIGTSLLY